MKSKTLPLTALLVALGAACYDPVNKDDVASLGEEAPGVPKGPLHRPGQHCTTCHSDDGPASPSWSVAGTIYSLKGQPTPEVGATITITDKIGSQLMLTSNNAGNFYVDKAQWDPIFPIGVSVQAQGKLISMVTTIGRDGGCGNCHRGPGDNHYQPAIWINNK